ncbi:MAG TPA: hypothetical protein VEU11_20300 [Terriglobales bacterium]|nr:hypothetical protein [Terriglobales bacterium]
MGAAIVILVVLALVASWAAAVIPMENATTTVDTDGRYLMIEAKTPLYYGAHGFAIASVLAAGLLAAFIGGFKTLSLTVRLAFYVLLLTAASWAVIAYTPEELLSSEIFGSTGPFTWFTLIFVMAGMDRRIWVYIDPVLRGLTYLSLALAVRTLISSPYHSFVGYSRYVLYAQLLTWLGGWTLLTATRLRGFRLLARAIPLMAGISMAICAQSRSWTILCCLLGAAFILLRSREHGSTLSGARTLAMACTLGAAAGAFVYTTMPHTFGASVSGLVGRIDQDTRTGQYGAFFEVVPVTDLLLGRGPKGTWYWPGFGEYQFFDNGFLWALFIGGIPTLLSYVTILLWPAIRALRHRPAGGDAAAVCLLLLAILALAGLSTFSPPSMGINGVLLSLWAGRCHLFLAERSERVCLVRRSTTGLRSPVLAIEKFRRAKFTDSSARGCQLGNS